MSRRRNHSGAEAPVRRSFGLVRPPRGGAGDDGQNRQRDEQKGEPEVQGVAQHLLLLGARESLERGTRGEPWTEPRLLTVVKEETDLTISWQPFTISADA